MVFFNSRARSYSSLLVWACLVVPVGAQSQPPSEPSAPPQAAGQDHDHTKMAAGGSGWQFMQEGVVYGLFNRQGGPRGDQEAIVPNWWMGMWQRGIGGQRLSITTMLSLDRVTVGESGYAELFQVGETLDGKPLVDRQHPHDFFMQLAAAWRIPLGSDTGLTIAGGPAAEPALGPVAFMHRASAVENPTAPLGHHTFDSTHISYGVITVAVDRGPWIVEGSLFNGREPDENRWNFDFAALDSVSGRLRFQPSDAWRFQLSTGLLKDPEALEAGNVVRTTASVSWSRLGAAHVTAVTAGYGMNSHEGEDRQDSFFTEGTWRSGENALYGRFEAHEPEIAVLVDEALDASGAGSGSTLIALTVGAVRDLIRFRGLSLGVGGDVSFYRVPRDLRLGYGSPTSFRLFVRLGVGRSL